MEQIPSVQSRQSETEQDNVLRAFRGYDREREILASFSKKERLEIRKKQQILSSLAYFIGKDFRIPVELNEPGGGWYWNFQDNVIRVDPKDLLERSIDYLRFVICHEGGHRRISRVDSIPLEVWKQPGFSLMMNAIEDGRDNNFVAEAYPRFHQQMTVAYPEDFEIMRKAKEEAALQLKFQPRFMEAGFEYLKQWFRETQGLPVELSPDLVPEVRAVVEKTLESARDSWWRYPSKQEADESEAIIKKYAQVSYEINLEEVWPEFKKLVDADVEDQKTQEALNDMKGDGEQEGSSGGLNVPQSLKDKLTPDEQKELQEAIDQAGGRPGGTEPTPGGEISPGSGDPGKPAPETEGGETPEGGPAGQAGQNESEKKETSTDGNGTKQGEDGKEEEPKPSKPKLLSEGLKKKIKEYIDSLPEDEKKKLIERAMQVIKELEKKLNEQLQAKLNEDPEQREDRDEQEKKEDAEVKEGKAEQNQGQDAGMSAGSRVIGGEMSKNPPKIKGERIFDEQKFKELMKDRNDYDKYRNEVLPLIDRLENELRQIFMARAETSWEGGKKFGKRIDIKRRIQEKAKEVPIMESRAWEKRNLPDVRDYAITLLVDVSGSTAWYGRIEEILKSVIVLAEVLNRLGINIEILGFNNDIKEYETFGTSMSSLTRERIGKMIGDANAKRCDVCASDHNNTDIGWATEVAAERLAKQKEKVKIMITLSDFQFEESPQHPSDQYDLREIMQKVLANTDIQPVGLGIGPDEQYIEGVYNQSLVNVDATQMAEKLAGLMKDLIENTGMARK